ncbi:M15 family metallopeptidase [bacterium]|nr:M15 family metallopeptidase [bacterium]
MASRDLDDLIPEVKEKALVVQKVCQEAGHFDLLIYCSLRPLEEQARLFRQSRSRKEINVKINKFNERGLGFLAEVIENVGPCYGRHVTNAAPGESWHNYGQAWDAVPMINSKPCWNYFQAKAYWDAYGEAVRKVGMYWAGDWTRFREYPHAQLSVGGNPLKTMTAEQVREALAAHDLLVA